MGITFAGLLLLSVLLQTIRKGRFIPPPSHTPLSLYITLPNRANSVRSALIA